MLSGNQGIESIRYDDKLRKDDLINWIKLFSGQVLRGFTVRIDYPDLAVQFVYSAV